MVNERLIRNKKGVLPRTWAVSVIVFVSVIALLYVSSNGFLNEYSQSSSIDEDFNTTYNKYDELTTGDMNISGKWQEMTDEGGWADVWDTVFGLPSIFISVIKYIAQSVVIVTQIPGEIGADLGADSSVTNIVTGLIITVLTIILIFAIISSVSRSNRI